MPPAIGIRRETVAAEPLRALAAGQRRVIGQHAEIDEGVAILVAEFEHRRGVPLGLEVNAADAMTDLSADTGRGVVKRRFAGRVVAHPLGLGHRLDPGFCTGSIGSLVAAPG